MDAVSLPAVLLPVLSHVSECLLKGRHKSAHEHLLPALVHGCHFRLVQLVQKSPREQQRGINEGSSAHGPSMGVITWQ